MNSAYLMKKIKYIRDFIRDFYIYGYKSRRQFENLSGSSYDNKLNTVQAVFPDYLDSYYDGGKKFFIPIDSRSGSRNPLYKLFKMRSFTPSNIVTSFFILDYLKSKENSASAGATIIEMLAGMIGYSALFDSFNHNLSHSLTTQDEKTFNKRLRELRDLGVICAKNDHRGNIYSLAKDPDIFSMGLCDAVQFFSEVSLCGVIGSYILDKYPCKDDIFCYKHHCLSNALDSEICYNLLNAIQEKSPVTIDYKNSRKNRPLSSQVLPLCIFTGTRTGRQYLISVPIEKHRKGTRLSVFRLDYINSVKIEKSSPEIFERFDVLRNHLCAAQKHIWGVSIQNPVPKRVFFQLRIDDQEEHIYHRLVREKRCGKITRNGNLLTFEAELFDPQEILPWVRSFTGRIARVDFSDPALTKKFYDDMKSMYDLYAPSKESE